MVQDPLVLFHVYLLLFWDWNPDQAKFRQFHLASFQLPYAMQFVHHYHKVLDQHHVWWVFSKLHCVQNRQLYAGKKPCLIWFENSRPHLFQGAVGRYLHGHCDLHNAVQCTLNHLLHQGPIPCPRAIWLAWHCRPMQLARSLSQSPFLWTTVHTTKALTNNHRSFHVHRSGPFQR